MKKIKGKKKTVVCANLKQTSTKYDVMCRTMLRKILYIQKRHVDEFMFVMFSSMISRYIATSCELKKSTKSYFIINVF